MRIRIKRIDKGLPLPEYMTPEATSADLYTRKNTVVLPGRGGLYTIKYRDENS